MRAIRTHSQISTAVPTRSCTALRYACHAGQAQRSVRQLLLTHLRIIRAAFLYLLSDLAASSYPRGGISDRRLMVRGETTSAVNRAELLEKGREELVGG